MATRYFNKLGLLAKIETTYGTDAVPTGAANAIVGVDVALTPLEAQERERELILPYLGHQGVVLTGYTARVEFSVEMAGAGAAGTAPKYGPLLRACGMSETITAGTKVEYKPVSSGFEALSLYYNLDGTNHILLGARGTWQTELTPQGIPRIRFTFIGLQGAIADVPMPALTLTGFIKALPVNKANTSFIIHGATLPMERFAFNLGNDLQPRLLVNWESIEIVDRKVTGSVVLEATQAAVKDWIAVAKAHTTGVIDFGHGTVAGNIVDIDCPVAQVGRPTQGQSQRILNNTLPLMMIPSSAGNDEIVLTVR